MSQCLRDSSINHLNEALKLIQGSKKNEASTDFEQAGESSLKAEAYDVSLYV